VFFNPFNTNEMLVTSFGNGLKTGVMNPTPVSEIPPAESDFLVYPNPFSEKLCIRSKIENIPFQIINLYGQEIYKGSLKPSINEINTSHWPAGVYFIRINEQDYRICRIYR
jgi:hypothetical protein